MKIRNWQLFSPLAVTLFTTLCHATSCPVAKTHAVSEPEQEFLRGHFDRAATLYQASLQKTPNDPASVAGLVHVLLRQQKIAEADTLVTSALTQNANSAPLLIALGEVQYREGTPWLAQATVAKAAKVDLCYARMYLLTARLSRLSSGYASAAKSLATAHALDPQDPAVRRQWLATLPLARRIAELESYLASDTGDDPDDLTHLKNYLASLKKQRDEPHKSCRLVSQASATGIPFVGMMGGYSHTVQFFGLDVKLNDHNARLQIDTGASGLVINHSVAEHAHLQRFVSGTSGGIGGTGEASSYSAYADNIKIGALEFHDCLVEVIEGRNMHDTDGLIGMDVFSSFLVTLDFPLRKLALGTLPRRPDEVVATPTLQTAQSSDQEDFGDDDDAPARPASPAPSSASGASPPVVQVRGPHDRFVAPEMTDWTRVYRVGHLLLIPAALNDSSPKMMVLDTGAFSTTLNPTVARTVTKIHGDSNITVTGVTGKVDKVFTADKVELKFANLKQTVNGVIVFDSPSISKNAGLEIAGFIGATALGQVAMSIDYRDGLVKFNYNANRGYKYPGIP